MTSYMLVLIVYMSNRGVAMTSAMDFPNRGSCESAGVAFVTQAKTIDDHPHFYCVPTPERSSSPR